MGESNADPQYIPAARWRVLSRVYDPVLALTMREGHFRAAMRDKIDDALPQGGSVLDAEILARAEKAWRGGCRSPTTASTS